MTSRKSSLNPFAFTYREMLHHRIFTAIPMTILAMLFFGEVIPKYFSWRSAVSSGDTSFAQSIKGDMLFSFITDGDGSIIMMAYSFVLLGIGLVLAVSLFGFMMLKPSANVQYSLSISRNKQFAARYLAGTTVIAASVIIPFFIVSLANMMFYGNSKELWISFAYLCISHLTVFLYSFTVYVFVMVLLGSIIESILIGTVCLFVPAMISNAFYSLLSVMVYGSPQVNSSAFDFGINFVTAGGEKVAGGGEKAFRFTDYLFPAMSGADSLNVLRGEEYIFPPVLRFAVALALVLLLACAAKYLHSRRKAEKAGFLGTCPALETFCTVVVGSFLASLAGQMLNSSEFSRGAVKAITVIAGAVIMAIGSTAVELVFTRSFKEYRKRIWHLPLAICIFLAFVFITGVVINSAYAKIPAAQDIRSASISLPGSVEEYRYSNDTISEAGHLPIDFMLTEQAQDRTVFETASAEDIADILEINRLAVNPDKNTRGIYSVRFEYTLKNGRKVERIYRDAGKYILEKSVGLMDREFFRKGTVEILNNLKGGIYGPMMISPNLSSIIIPAEIFNDREKADELFACIEKDILAGGIPLDFKGGEVFGYIGYDRYNPADDIRADNTNGYYVTTTGADEDGEEEEQTVLHGNLDYIKYYEGNIDLANLHAFPVFAGAENTVAFLESNGLMKYFENREDFAKITYCRYKDGDRTYPNDTLTGLLSARWVDKDYSFDVYYADGSIQSAGTGMPAYATVVTDKAEIEKLQKKMRAVAWADDDGCYVKAEFRNGDYVLAYMPE
ncbi:MAG: ABC transporter permease [Clostridia bacterium]|nr:ABC transporter permease [Clostridia bacterium]